MPGRAGDGRIFEALSWLRPVGTLCVLAMVPSPVAAGADVAVAAVEPARTDSTLVCWVETSGIPDPNSRRTLESGLPSSVVVAVHLVSEGGRTHGGSRSEVRVEPNLWEQNFTVWTAGTSVRVDSLQGLDDALGRIGPLTVLPLDGLIPDTYRLRVRLAIHPLAPSESQRVTSIFAGDVTPGGVDRKEVSVGLGSVIRFFMGRDDSEDWVADGFSGLFGIDELPRIGDGRGEPAPATEDRP